MDPLASVEDLEVRLGMDLTKQEKARAEALLADASALIRGYTGQDFTFTPDDVLTTRPVGTVVRLPQRPVTEVSKVVAVGGSDVVPDIVLPDGSWAFDGIDKVNVWPPDVTWLLSLPEIWLDEGLDVDTYTITYSHGYQKVPADVVAVMCGMVLSSLTAPSMVSGLMSETIGNYSYRLGSGSGASHGGATVTLTDDDRSILNRYRRQSTTIAVKAV